MGQRTGIAIKNHRVGLQLLTTGQFNAAGSAVTHQNALAAAHVNFDINARGASVEAVFHEFFNDGNRPFNHLTGRNLVDHGVFEGANFRRVHGAKCNAVSRASSGDLQQLAHTHDIGI